jgi:hypothetical protein
MSKTNATDLTELRDQLDRVQKGVRVRRMDEDSSPKGLTGC